MRAARKCKWPENYFDKFKRGEDVGLKIKEDFDWDALFNYLVAVKVLETGDRYWLRETYLRNTGKVEEVEEVPIAFEDVD